MGRLGRGLKTGPKGSMCRREEVGQLRGGQAEAAARLVKRETSGRTAKAGIWRRVDEHIGS